MLVGVGHPCVVVMVYIEREMEREVKKWLRDREILAIRGPRQSGKTTLLMRIKEMLKGEGVEEKRIQYVSFEDDLTRMRFEENPREFMEFHLTSEKKHYFLMDEVQYIRDVGKKLKLLFDSMSNAKIVITGSSSFDLTNLGSYLVGRVVFFNLYPFSFLEFLRTKGEKYENLYRKVRIDIGTKKIQIRKTVFLEDLDKFLHEYLTYGSYPRIVLEKSPGKKRKLLKNLFTTYVEKDVVSLYGIRYRNSIVKFLKAVAAISGDMVNYETLSSNAGLKYHEVRNILPMLEDSFVISVVRPFHRNLINELRKNPKIYFIDYGFRNHLLGSFEHISFDRLYENFIHNQLKRHSKVRYWRTTAKTEVDFIAEHKKEIVPVEVKTTPKITRSFRSFLQSYRPKRGIIANRKKLDSKKVNGCEIFILPLVYF